MTGTATTRRHHVRTRTALVTGLLALLLSACTSTTTTTAPAEPGPAVVDGTTAGPTDRAGSTHAPPVATGVASAADIERAVSLMLDAGDRYDTLIRAFLVQVDGETLVAHYHPDSGPEATNDVYSVTKSVMSMLIGIAIDEGSIAGVDRTLAELLPQHVDIMAPGVGEVTLEQILTMTGGLLPDDDPGWLDPHGQPDWVVAMLATPLTEQPGASFRYSSLGSHLLSAILVTATDLPVLDYAREKVFGPLGIVTEPAAEPVAVNKDWTILYQATPGFAWTVDPQGLHLGFADLKITAPDMVKLGQLYLDHGEWAGEQIVPAAWVARSTSPLVETGSAASGYGYQWWIPSAGDHAAFAAFGYAGQLIEVVPDLDLVVAVACLDAPAGFDATSFTPLIDQNIIPLLEG